MEEKKNRREKNLNTTIPPRLRKPRKSLSRVLHGLVMESWDSSL